MTAPPSISVSAARDILVDGDSSATVLFVLALRVFPDLLTRDESPESIEIWMALEEHFGVEISVNCENRVNALWLAMSGDGFYENPEIFTAVCSALFDGDIGDPLDAVTDELGVEEVLWACYEISLWHGELDEFDPRVARVIACVSEMDVLEEDEANTIHRRAVALRKDLEKLGLDPDELSQFFNDGMGQSSTTINEAPPAFAVGAPGRLARTGSPGRP